MIKHIRIPDSIGLRTSYKRKFSAWEMYQAYTRIPNAVALFRRNKKEKQVDEALLERLQLAVTEVNGCAACSYVHTQIALKQGMSNEEISSFLEGTDAFVQPAEAKAIAFAQHFADARGIPTAAAYQAIVDEYGAAEAAIMRAATQLMLVGNIYGIPYSAFRSRLKGKPFKNSTLGYELGMQIGGLLMLPLALLHGLLANALGRPALAFQESQAV